MITRGVVATLALIGAALCLGIEPGGAAADSMGTPCEVSASYTPNAYESWTADQNQYLAQVFSAGLGVSDPFVTLELAECKSNGPVDAQLEIVLAPGGVPDWGNPLGTTVVPAAQILDACVGGVFGAVIFEFPAVDLHAGTQYALVLKRVNGTGSIEWRSSSTPDDPSNPYAGGNAWTNGDTGPDELTNPDFLFSVCGTPNCSVTASYTPNAYEPWTADQNDYLAQVFTTGIGVGDPFVTLELAECQSNGLADAQLEIVAAPSGVPDWGNPLGTTVVSAAQILDVCVGGVFGPVTFEFPAVVLSAATQYALVLKRVNGTGTIDWRRSSGPDDPSNPYAGGNAWTNGNAGPEELTNLDFLFSVCGNSTVPVELSRFTID